MHEASCMAFKKIISIILISVVLIALGISCFYKKNTSFNISYTLNYDGDSWQKNRTGFLWTLSYLGAELPRGSFDKSLKWVDSTTFNIDFENLGFSDKALRAIETIIDSIKQTEHYKLNKHIDLAQFITLTIGSSWHYYAITGAVENYQQFKQEHGFKNEKVFPLLHSTVAKHNRLIKINSNDNVLKTVFIAEEGKGDFMNGDFIPKFYEVLDVMPNGQLRFAVYDKDGNLTDASSKELGEAGKPAKCLWCHEIVFQPLFVEADSVPGKMSPNEFQRLVERQNNLLTDYRKTLTSDVDFNMTQDHTEMELLYISYMEPSLNKLSAEWGIKAVDLKKILMQQKTHLHHEFNFMKDIYYRRDINRYNPFKYIDVADDVREPSKFEPNFCYKIK